MAEYRIDELAEVSGVTVRNIRFYQEKGLLQPPRKVGRVGIYSEAHLGRLKLVGQMIERGYTFAAIGDLLSAWESGRDISEVLGLEEALTQPWQDETPRHITIEELVALLGQGLDLDSVGKLVEQGSALRLIKPTADGFEVTSPALLEAASELVALGIPLERIVDSAATLLANLRVVGLEMVALIAREVADTGGAGQGKVSPGDIPEVVRRLRPHAKRAMDALFAITMEEVLTESAEVLTRKYKSGQS